MSHAHLNSLSLLKARNLGPIADVGPRVLASNTDKLLQVFIATLRATKHVLVRG